MRLTTLYMPEPYLRALDRLVAQKYYLHRAEAIRLAVRDYLQSYHENLLRENGAKPGTRFANGPEKEPSQGRSQ